MSQEIIGFIRYLHNYWDTVVGDGHFRGDGDDGVVLVYDISEREYIALSVSGAHIGMRIAVDTDLCYVYERLVAKYELFDDPTEVSVYDMFLNLPNMEDDEGVTPFVDMLQRLFDRVEVRCMGGRCEWKPETRQHLEAALKTALKRKTGNELHSCLRIDYLDRGDSRTYNCGSPDSWDYSEFDPIDEDPVFAQRFEEMKRAVLGAYKGEP